MSMAIPREFARSIQESIFERNIRSAEDACLIRGDWLTLRSYSFDCEIYFKWGASLLGKYVLSGERDLLEDASCRLNHVVLFGDGRCKADVFFYLSILNTLQGCLCDHDVSRLHCFVDARCDIERATAQKNYNEQFYQRCETSILRALEANLKANNPTKWIKRALRYLSFGLPDEERDNNETAVVGFEDLIQCLRKVVHRGGLHSAEELARSGPSINYVSCYSDSGADEDSDEDSEGPGVYRLFLYFLDNSMVMQNGAAQETAMGGSGARRSVRKPEMSMDEKQDDLESIIAELKEVTLLVIFEQFRRTAEAICAKESNNVENLTLWGAALLGLSLQKGCEDPKACLEGAVSKLEEALEIDGNKTDVLCYAGHAYAALAWLTSEVPETSCYRHRAEEYIGKAMDKDPDRAWNVSWTLEEFKKRKHGDGCF